MCRKHWIRVGRGPMWLCAWIWPWMVLVGAGVVGMDVAGMDVAGMDVAGMDVAREEWGKRLVLVVPLDRASRRRMCEGWRHPDVVRGWG